MPRAEWEASDISKPYLPAYYEQEGFIHCTDGADNLAATGNRHYRHDPREFFALVVDLDRLTSRVVYEDSKGIYPHIYGPLNRDAVLRVLPVPRSTDGAFLPVEE